MSIEHDMTVADLRSERLTMTVAEAAEVLGIGRATAYECVRSGEIPSITLGRRILIPRHALYQLIGTEAA